MPPVLRGELLEIVNTYFLLAKTYPDCQGDRKCSLLARWLYAWLKVEHLFISERKRE